MTSEDYNESQLRSQRLWELTVPAIKRMLREKNLPLGGRKGDLIARLLESMELNEEDDGDKDSQEIERPLAGAIQSASACIGLPPLVLSSDPETIEIYKDHVEAVPGISISSRQLLLNLAIHMRCPHHMKALSRLTGPELERMCDVLIPGLKLSKGAPKATAYCPIDITGPMKPFTDAVKAVVTEAPSDDSGYNSQSIPRFTDPMATFPPKHDQHRDKVWVKLLKKRDEGCIVRGDDLAVEAAHFIPNMIVFDGCDSPFWAFVFVLFGEKTMKDLKSQVVEGSRELIGNSMTLGPEIHKAWDQGRLRFDFVENDETYIDIRLIVIRPTKKWERVLTLTPSRPGLPTLANGRILSTGDIYRVTTTDPKLMPIPTRLIVETRSAFQRMWMSAGLYPGHSDSTATTKRKNNGGGTESSPGPKRSKEDDETSGGTGKSGDLQLESDESKKDQLANRSSSVSRYNKCQTNSSATGSGEERDHCEGCCLKDEGGCHDDDDDDDDDDGFTIRPYFHQPSMIMLGHSGWDEEEESDESEAEDNKQMVLQRSELVGLQKAS